MLKRGLYSLAFIGNNHHVASSFISVYRLYFFGSVFDECIVAILFTIFIHFELFSFKFDHGKR